MTQIVHTRPQPLQVVNRPAATGIDTAAPRPRRSAPNVAVTLCAHALLQLCSRAAELPFVTVAARGKPGLTGCLIAGGVRLDVQSSPNAVQTLDGTVLLKDGWLHCGTLYDLLQLCPAPLSEHDIAYLCAGMSRQGPGVYFQGTRYALHVRHTDTPDGESHMLETAHGLIEFAVREQGQWRTSLHLLAAAITQRTIPPQ